MQAEQSRALEEPSRIKPLDGVTIVEVGGIGPGPFAGMVLAGMGARVHRIERPGTDDPPRGNALLRGRVMHSIDLKRPDGVTQALELIAGADAVYEGFRPGVMERLGLGPDVCFAANPALVYARVTGWGQHGPYAAEPGHDINYLAISGVLNTIGPAGGAPLPPVNYVADYGSGGMLLVNGLLAGLVRRHVTGCGSVVDVAMVDGAAMMLADLASRLGSGSWLPARGVNAFDGGSPFYRTYRTRDDRYMAVGAVEPQFYAEFLGVLGLDDVDVSAQYDRSAWPALTERIAAVFATQTQQRWRAAFDSRPACVSPVLDWEQLTDDPHLRARGTFEQANGTMLPEPAPRFGTAGHAEVDEQAVSLT